MSTFFGFCGGVMFACMLNAIVAGQAGMAVLYAIITMVNILNSVRA